MRQQRAHGSRLPGHIQPWPASKARAIGGSLRGCELHGEAQDPAPYTLYALTPPSTTTSPHNALIPLPIHAPSRFISLDKDNNEGGEKPDTELQDGSVQSTSKDEACMTGEACRLGRYQAVVTGQAEQHPASILLDTGASGNFIDQTYVRKHRLTQDKLARPRQVLLFDGQPSSSGKITHKVNALLEVVTTPHCLCPRPVTQ